VDNDEGDNSITQGNSIQLGSLAVYIEGDWRSLEDMEEHPIVNICIYIFTFVYVNIYV
jgi:hypothetical protein